MAKFWKNDKEIEPNKFSSGEREIFNFLYGIIATNARNGIVLIDEPELHLHPKWQGMFLSLFQEFAKGRALQFVLTTHSPAFVTHRTIDAVTRIYQRESVSRRAAVRSGALPERAQLVRLVHSHNNERIFFADRVVLVEGITDRLVLESILQEVSRFAATRETIEVIEVHGKSNVVYYKRILDQIDTPTTKVADLDYIVQVGDEMAKKLFVRDTQAVDKKILKDKKSEDRLRLLNFVEEAIRSGSTGKLSDFLEYMKGRFLRLKEDLSVEEQRLLEKEVVRLAGEGTLLWRRGEIESYLPDGVRSVGEVVEFLADEYWWQRLDHAIRHELVEVACAILHLGEAEAAEARSRFGAQEETAVITVAAESG